MCIGKFHLSLSVDVDMCCICTVERKECAIQAMQGFCTACANKINKMLSIVQEDDIYHTAH